MTIAQPSASSAFISYSANREDVFLNRLFAMRSTGFYVDIGAAHPIYENDTKALYDRGWHGINVEPNVGFFRELVAGRPRDCNLNLAVSDTPGNLTYHEVIGTGLSTCDPEEAARAAAKGFRVVQHQVESDTLRHILERARPSKIDLLKIDVEGFELRVLQSNDWTRFRPTLILAEATYPESPTRRPDELTPFLTGHGYHRVYFDGLNDYFVAQECNLPGNVFDCPPNVFDHFVPFLQHNLTRERDAARAYIGSLEAELARARTELLGMRHRGANLASQLETMSTQQNVEPQPDVSVTSRQLSRLLRAAKRPRRTLRILLGGCSSD
jgi:FkbM family methyltransferase